jgi:ActR/RegA family two-component response regulator
MKRAKPKPSMEEKKVLIVHPDLGMLSGLQGEFTKRGLTTIVARDLPTTLLAITQHYFDLAVISSKITEEGDGWPVGGVLRLIFPKAVLLVMTPQTDVLTLKSAINNGIDEICEKDRSAEQIVAAALEKSVAFLSPGSDRLQ